MIVSSLINLNLASLRDTYFDLLDEEDFKFKTKNITVNLKKVNSDTLEIKILVNSILDLKIGVNAVIKSLEVIDKTLKL